MYYLIFYFSPTLYNDFQNLSRPFRKIVLVYYWFNKLISRSYFQSICAQSKSLNRARVATSNHIHPKTFRNAWANYASFYRQIELMSKSVNSRYGILNSLYNHWCFHHGIRWNNVYLFFNSLPSALKSKIESITVNYMSHPRYNKRLPQKQQPKVKIFIYSS